MLIITIFRISEFGNLPDCITNYVNYVSDYISDYISDSAYRYKYSLEISYRKNSFS